MTTYEPKIRRFSAGDVLDQRSDLIDHIVGSGNSTLTAGSKFRDLIVGTMAGSATMRDPQTGLPRSKRAFVEVPGLIHAHLRFSEVFRVSADMTELITHAAALLDDTDRWDPSLLPTEAGFVRFDKPLVLRDSRGNDMLIHAMTWGPARLAAQGEILNEEATFVSMWNDCDVEADHYLKQMMEEHGHWLRKVAGRWSFIGAEVMTNGQRMGPALLDPALLGVTDPAISTPFTNNHRLIMALCMLMDQTIVQTESERPNVHARRRAKERKTSQSDITVVTLRRRSVPSQGGGSESSESRREWHHRWIVRGHWRWARVGPGRQETRRVWVSGHVKGPDDKPLRITTKVYDLKR